MSSDVPSLPYPVTFVIRHPERWPELFQPSQTSIPDPNFLCDRIKTNEDCWIVLTYLHLKRKHLNVSISDRFVPGEICVVSGLDFGISDRTFNSFIVGCRSDGFQPFLCDLTVVQNQACVSSRTDIFIPHWPQPGLIPRLKERGSRIENIVFKGDEINLYESFRSPEFKRQLEKIGVKLRINTLVENEPVMWHDYSTDDLVLAVRDVTEKDGLVKPASKLINAWIAGVPALLGPEPPFREQRQSDLDYIEVTTPQAVFEAIKLLKSRPELYQQIIANSHKRAEDFTTEKMIDRWYQLLAGPAADGYKRWSQKNQLSRMAEFSLRSIQHKIAGKKAAYNRLHGYRPISGTHT
ncbi:glycosyltransferase [Tychonema sp. LEGE 07203]|nr:glycosyltransferase [Tychonema sp. LEGE 07203]